MIDTWYDIKGFIGLYKISGRLEVMNIKTGNKVKSDRHNINLYKNGSKKRYTAKFIYQKLRVFN